MIKHLAELLNGKVPINLGSLINSFDKVIDSQKYYEVDILEDDCLCSFIEGIIENVFVSIMYMPYNNNELRNGDDINNSDEVIIVFMRTELHDKKYYVTYYDRD